MVFLTLKACSVLSAGQSAAAGAAEAARLVCARVSRGVGVLAARKHGQLPARAAHWARAVRQLRGAAVEHLSKVRALGPLSCQCLAHVIIVYPVFSVPLSPVVFLQVRICCMHSSVSDL